MLLLSSATRIRLDIACLAFEYTDSFLSFSVSPIPHPRFIGLLEKALRPPKDRKVPRVQVPIQVLPGIPFFKNTESIFILHTLIKFAAPASLLCLYGADQQRDRLGQLLVLLGKNLHSYGEQDHADPRCKWQAKNRGKGRRPESSFNNKGLDEWEGGVENIETICWPSILGGTSIY